MRMYALYERSRKVLALYILVAVVILVMACVSPDFSGISTLPDIQLLISWHTVGDAGWKKRTPSGRATTHGLRWNFESRKVSISL
jgi:hypothetical protein